MVDDAMAEVRDRELIRKVVSRYCHSIDRRDHAAIATCFTEDVQAEYAGQVIGTNRDEVMAWFGRTRNPTEQNPKLPSGTPRQGMHFLGDVDIAIDGDTAKTEAYAVIYRVEVGEPDRLIVRGVRYLDELRREGDEWRISRRYHTADWAFETTASLGIDPSGRPAHPLLPFPMG